MQKGRKSYDPVNFPPLSEKEMLNKYNDRVRRGKTAKDKRKKGTEE